MPAKLTRLTHKIAIQLHVVAESCTFCSSPSRRPVRKLLETPSYDEYSSSRSTVVASRLHQSAPLFVTGLWNQWGMNVGNHINIQQSEFRPMTHSALLCVLMSVPTT